ncbi:hypothetical protein LQ318_01500 [Aliifodinibius salicampi]|uniref:Uncharacterized protein n=1 Tax=Fodinibius salicampi TaxID=1920655 RepID=A0ABT3PUM7_9BACT|nr:hypothetical protein [Fodinibius salicampi]MCW9711566.1 hypothetical protein [Fodinibius salicampi]
MKTSLLSSENGSRDFSGSRQVFSENTRVLREEHTSSSEKRPVFLSEKTRLFPTTQKTLFTSRRGRFFILPFLMVE